MRHQPISHLAKNEWWNVQVFTSLPPGNCLSSVKLSNLIYLHVKQLWLAIWFGDWNRLDCFSERSPQGIRQGEDIPVGSVEPFSSTQYQQLWYPSGLPEGASRALLHQLFYILPSGIVSWCWCWGRGLTCFTIAFVMCIYLVLTLFNI